MTADDKWLADHFSVISVGAPMKRQPFDVVAYTFQAALVCPDCVVPLLFELFEQPFPHAPHVTTEAKLGVLAKQVGIDYRDEHSYDSDEFPKVVFRDQLADADLEGCDVCGADLTRQ